MELKRYNKKREKLNILLEILGEIDFEGGDSYVHPPMIDEPLPKEANAIYLRDRIYAIIRAEKHILEQAGHYDMIHTLDRFKIQIKDNRLHFLQKTGSIIYDSIKEPDKTQQQDNDDTDWK